MSYTPGKIVWWELSTHNANEAAAFYTELIGWKKVEWPMPDGRNYVMFGMDPEKSVAGMSALGDEMAQVPNHWQPFVSVDDVDATAEAIKANGGEVVAGPMDIPNTLRMAVCKDPHGAMISVMKSVEGDAEETKSSHGKWHWAELYSPNVPESLAFYTAVFGYTVDEMDMGPGKGTYYMLQKEGRMFPVGGVMARPKEEIPPMWANYLDVDDTDAVFAAAVKGGATPIVEPVTMPGIGRFAQIMDPNNTFVGFITPDRSEG